LVNEFIDFLRCNWLGESPDKHQNGSLPNELATGVGGFEPEAIPLNRQTELVARQEVELFPKRLGQHYPPRFIHLNHFVLHGI
jgi:hypothetical protein